MDLRERIRQSSPEEIRMYAKKTELPAMESVLSYIAKQQDKEYWVNQYCDQCSCLW